MDHILDHPKIHRCGTRVLMLKGRNKDGVENRRTIQRVTHSPEQFNRELEVLAAIATPGERIYSSACPRDLPRAIRKFKERQLANDYSPEPTDFYTGLLNRWISCLMSPEAQVDKLWLLDCDSGHEVRLAEEIMSEHYDRPMSPYIYETKSGTHILLQPFNRSKLFSDQKALIHTNPLILWGY